MSAQLLKEPQQPGRLSLSLGGRLLPATCARQPMERLFATPASSPWQRASDYFLCNECSALTRVSVPRSHAVCVAAAQPRSPYRLAGPRGDLSPPHGTVLTVPLARRRGSRIPRPRVAVTRGARQFPCLRSSRSAWRSVQSQATGNSGPPGSQRVRDVHIQMSRWGQSLPEYITGWVRVPRDISIQAARTE